MTFDESKMVRSPLLKDTSSSKKRTSSLDWKNQNERIIYNLVNIKGPLTRPELVKETGLSPSTLYDVLTRLSIQGLIVQYSD